METKQLIVNGSLNPSMTSEELLQLEGEDLIQAAWYIQVSITRGYSLFYPEVMYLHAEIYAKICEEVKIPCYTHADLHTNTKEKLDVLLKAKEAIKIRYMVDLEFKEAHQGRELYRLQKELNFKGRFDLTPFQLMGYISARGNWNCFETVPVKRAIRKLELSVPVRDFGINNPNTGMREHQWSIENDYIYLKSPYLSQREGESDKWAIFFSTFEVSMEGAKADSIQSSKTTNGASITGFEFYAWWD